MKIVNNNKDTLYMQSKAIIDCLYAMQNNTPAEITDGERKVTVQASQAPKVIREVVAKAMDIFGATDLPRGEGSQIAPGKDPLWHVEGGSLSVIQSVFDRITPSDNRLEWELGEVDNAFELRKLTDEKEITIKRLSAGKQTAEIFLYGDGLKIPFPVIYQKQYYKMERILKQARSAIMRKMNEVHIDLLKSAGGANTTAFSGAQSGWTALDRWTDTLNKARLTMCSRFEKIIENPYSETLYFLAHPAQQEKWTYVTSPQFTFNKRTALDNNIKPIFNHMIPNDNKALLVLPKYLIQNAILIDEEFDIWEKKEDKSMVMGAFTLFGAAVGDTKQVQTLTLA